MLKVFPIYCKLELINFIFKLVPGNPPASASSNHGASNANSELSAHGKKKSQYLFQCY